MSEKKRLTKRLVDALQPGPAAYSVWDTDVRGFYVRVLPTGRKVYTMYYRDRAGKQYRPKIGIHGEITVDKAREIAGDWREAIAEGKDPLNRGDDGKPVDLVTVADLYDRFDREHMKVRQKPRTQANNRSIWKNHLLPKIGKLPASSVTRDDLAEIHHAMADTPVNANRVLEVAKKAFQYAELWGWRQPGTNPCEHIEAFPEKKRKRYMTRAEAGRLGKALLDWEAKRGRYRDVSRLVRLLVLTGARLTEIMHSRLDWVDHDRSVIMLPDSKTGEKELMLPAAGLAIIQEIERDPDHKSQFIIPGDASKRRRGKDRDADIPMSYPYDLWAELMKQSEITDLRIHDLRHSFASIALDVTKNLPMVGELLGHADSKTTARYAHLMDDPKRQAIDASAEQVRTWLDGKVVSLAEEAKKRKSGDGAA